jgi:hypothetical protein
MPSGSFEKTNIGWQLQQGSRQVSEWVEWQLSQISTEPTETSGFQWPAWLLALGSRFFQIVFWGLVAVCGVWLVWQLLQAIFPTLKAWNQQWQKRWQRDRPIPTSPEAAFTAAGWVQRSQVYQRQGNYREACRALYFALLQRLNETQVVPQQTSRTDGEYLELLRNLPESQLYQLLITTHEQLCFNNAPVSSELLQHCQQAYQAIDRQVSPRSHPA